MRSFIFLPLNSHWMTEDEMGRTRTWMNKHFTWQTWREGATSETLGLKNNTEVDHKGIEFEEQTGFIWQWTLVNTVMNHIIPQNMQYFLTSWVTISFSRTMLFHGPSQQVNLILSQFNHIYITTAYHLSITHSNENAWYILLLIPQRCGNSALQDSNVPFSIHNAPLPTPERSWGSWIPHTIHLNNITMMEIKQQTTKWPMAAKSLH